MRILRIISIFVAAAGLVLAGTSVASADGEPEAVLHLTWSAPEVSLQVFSATVTCSPDSGLEEQYMDPGPVCAEIAQANGDFDALPGWQFVDCTGYSGWKIRTTATGYAFGKTVNYDKLWPNICEARRGTGWVFDW